MSNSVDLLKQFYSKAAHLIINARCHTAKVRNNKWFNLVSPEHIKISHFVHLEILSGKLTIELYKLNFIKSSHNVNITTTYQHCVSFFRSLFSILRLLPAYKIPNLSYRINSPHFEYPINIQEMHLGSVTTDQGVFSLHVYYTDEIPTPDTLEKVHEDLLNSLGTTPPQVFKRLGKSSFSPPSPDIHRSPSSTSLHEQKSLYKRSLNQMLSYKRPSDKRLSLQTSVGSLPTQQFSSPSLGVSLTRQKSQPFESDHLPFATSTSSINSSLHSSSPTSPYATDSGIFKMEENRLFTGNNSDIGSALPLQIPTSRRELHYPSTFSVPTPPPNHFHFTPDQTGGFRGKRFSGTVDQSPTFSSSSRPFQHDSTLAEFISETKNQLKCGLFDINPSPPRVIDRKKSVQQLLAIEKYKNMHASFSSDSRCAADAGDLEKQAQEGKKRKNDATDEDLLLSKSELDL